MSQNAPERVLVLTRIGATPDPQVVIQRARPAGAAIARAGHTAIVVTRDERRATTYLVVPMGVGGDAVVSAVTAAVGARADTAERPPNVAATPVVLTAVARPSDMAARVTQAGHDPTEVAQLVRRLLIPGQWVAVSLRPATSAEAKRAKTWFRHRTDGAVTHYANDSDPLIATFLVGAETKEHASTILSQLVAGLPGFDVETTSRVVVGGRHLPGSATLAMERELAAGIIPAPDRRTLPPIAPRPHRVRQDGSVSVAQSGSYPLASTSFLVSAAMVVGLATQHAGSASEASGTRYRAVPPPLVERVGPVVGYAGDDLVPVHISAADLWAGVAILGAPGMGKTVLVQNLWGWSSMERTAGPSVSGSPGAAHTLVAFEEKGEGVAGWQQWIQQHGDAQVLCELGDPVSPSIDLFSAGDTPSERAVAFVNSMVYAFGEGDIQGRAYETLTVMAAAALSFDLPSLWSAAQCVGDANPMTAISILLGTQGDEVAVHLAKAMIAASGADGATPEMVHAGRQLAPFFGPGSTPANRRTLTESSRNKVHLLLESEAAASWWSTTRPRFRWDDALDGSWAVICNMGTSTSGRLVSDRLRDVLSAMVLFNLRQAIQRKCGGWQSQGRSVTIFADELMMLAQNSEEIVSWIRNQGRSYGVRAVFAAQFPESLRDDVRKALLGFSTVFWFRQTNPGIAAAAAAQLSMTGEEWTQGDIAGLEPYTAILMATADGRIQPPTPIKVAYWGDDPGRFAADQRGVSGLPGADQPDTPPPSAAPPAEGAPHDAYFAR